MSGPLQTGLTWDDLLAFGEDGVRRELIDGALYVSPAARYRHQHVVVRLSARILGYVEERGGSVAAGPNVYFTHRNTVEPDVVVLAPDDLHRIQGLKVEGPPTIVIEVSSPSDRGYDLITKRALYERFGVPEYWFVDLDTDHIHVYCLDHAGYGDAEVVGRGEKVRSTAMDGLVLDIDDVLGSPEEGR
ncbi:MAG: Uma2 family endonuclease [Egibacteraceae bacterium]